MLPRLRYPSYLAARIRKKAFASDVPYVRYLACREACSRSEDPDDKEIISLSDNDDDPLVRFSSKEAKYGVARKEVYDAEKFLASSHQARLAMLRCLSGDGFAIANIISHALGNHLRDGRISEPELYEIVSDYILNPSFRQRFKGHLSSCFHGGIEEFEEGYADFMALWRLVPHCPEKIARLLIEELPSEAGIWTIPADVIADLSDSQLMILLDRPDVILSDLRRELFQDRNPKRESVRAAAISSNFSIENAEFTEILRLPNPIRLNVLRQLASYAHGLRLCIYEALHDQLLLAGKARLADDAKMSQEMRLTDLKPGWSRDEEMLELRLYLLARQTAREKTGSKLGIIHPPNGDLEFLGRHAVRGNIWSTFIAFQTQWQSFGTKALEKLLPPGIAEDSSSASASLSAVERSGVSAHVEGTPDQVQLAVRSEAASLDGITAIAETMSGVVAEVADLRRSIVDHSKHIELLLTELTRRLEQTIDHSGCVDRASDYADNNVDKDGSAAHSGNAPDDDSNTKQRVLEDLESSWTRIRLLLYFITAITTLVLIKCFEG